MISDKEYEENAERGRLLRLTTPYAIAAHFNPATGIITVDLNRGYSVSFHKGRSQALHKATDEQLSETDVSCGGASVFFPKLDDGFTVEGMLAGRFGNRHWERAWAEAHGLTTAETTSLETPVAA